MAFQETLLVYFFEMFLAIPGFKELCGIFRVRFLCVELWCGKENEIPGINTNNFKNFQASIPLI